MKPLDSNKQFDHPTTHIQTSASVPESLQSSKDPIIQAPSTVTEQLVKSNDLAEKGTRKRRRQRLYPRARKNAEKKRLLENLYSQMKTDNVAIIKPDLITGIKPTSTANIADVEVETASSTNPISSTGIKTNNMSSTANIVNVKAETTSNTNSINSTGINTSYMSGTIAKTNVYTKDDTIWTNQVFYTSTEFNMMNQLVTLACRNELHPSEPLSPQQLKWKNEILIQMSLNPDAIRSIRSNKIIELKMSKAKLDKLINDCKVILCNINHGGNETKALFTESRNKFMALSKNSNFVHDQIQNNPENADFELVFNKIKNIIEPLFSSEVNVSAFITKLINNPHALEDNETMKNQIASKNMSINDVMKDIKVVLDSLIKVRPSKTFFLPSNRYIDIPFVAQLYDKSGKMTEECATEIRGVLLNSIDSLNVQPKPKFNDVKFRDGSIIMVCVNRMSFNWLEKTISNHLAVNILPVKNVIPANKLKTICMKFEDPQYFHFNNLMEQLKVDNQGLLTRRWELRNTSKLVDSTKCIYVGVDVESLIVLEQMNRVATLRKSLVYFEIDYGDSEENFELMTFVKMKKRKKNKNLFVN